MKKGHQFEAGEARRQYVIRRILATAAGTIAEDERADLLTLAEKAGPGCVEDAKRFLRILELRDQAKQIVEAEGGAWNDRPFVFCSTECSEPWETQS